MSKHVVTCFCLIECWTWCCYPMISESDLIWGGVRGSSWWARGSFYYGLKDPPNSAKFVQFLYNMSKLCLPEDELLDSEKYKFGFNKGQTCLFSK